MQIIKNNILVVQLGRHGAGPRFAVKLAEALYKDSRVNSVTILLNKYRDPEIVVKEKQIREVSILSGQNSIQIVLGRFLFPRELNGILVDINIMSFDIVILPMDHLWHHWIVKKMNPDSILCKYVHDIKSHPGDFKSFIGMLLMPKIKRKLIKNIFLSRQVYEMCNDLKLKEVSMVLRHPPLIKGNPKQQTTTDKKRKRILFIGRILKYKGLNNLVKCCSILHNNGASIELCIAGDGKLPTSLGSVQFPLIIINKYLTDDEISKYIESAWIVALPYTEASQSGIISIANAFGIPCVATPVGGLVEQIVQGVNGMISSEPTAESFAVTLLELINNEQKYIELRCRTVEYAQRQYSWDNHAKELLDSVINYVNEK